MGHVIAFALSILGALFLTFLFQDLYACADRIERAILRFATLMLPKADRNEAFDQWWGDVHAKPRSELLRLLFALDCIRGGAVIGATYLWRNRKDWLAERAKNNSRIEISVRPHPNDGTELRYVVSEELTHTFLEGRREEEFVDALFEGGVMIDGQTAKAFDVVIKSSDGSYWLCEAKDNRGAPSHLRRRTGE